jgi:hypothetical protein
MGMREKLFDKVREKIGSAICILRFEIEMRFLRVERFLMQLVKKVGS